MNLKDMTGKQLIELAEKKGINWRKFRKDELIKIIESGKIPEKSAIVERKQTKTEVDVVIPPEYIKIAEKLMSKFSGKSFRIYISDSQRLKSIDIDAINFLRETKSDFVIRYVLSNELLTTKNVFVAMKKYGKETYKIVAILNKIYDVYTRKWENGVIEEVMEEYIEKLVKI